MAKTIIKIIRKICMSFVMLYGLNLIINMANITIPINIITIVLVSILGIPGIFGLIITYFLI